MLYLLERAEKLYRMMKQNEISVIAYYHMTGELEDLLVRLRLEKKYE